MLFDEWVGKRELVRLGIKWDLSKWYKLSKKVGWNVIERYIEAGFKDVQFVEKCIREEVMVGKAVEFRYDLKRLGIDEDKAEFWLYRFMDRFYTFVELYEHVSKDISIIGSLLRYVGKRKKVEDLLGVFMEYGLTREEALQELWYFPHLLDNPEKDLSVETVDKWFSHARKHGFKTVSVLRVLNFQKKLKKRLDFYLSLGLSEVHAEWWAGSEVYRNVFLSVEDFRFWHDEKGIKLLKDIYFLMDDLAYYLTYYLENGLTAEDIREWYGKGLDPSWKFTGLDMKDAKAWSNLGLDSDTFMEIKDHISYEDFKSLLDEGFNEAKTLVAWLKWENFNVQRIRDWYSLELKDYNFVSKLIQKGFNLDRMKELSKSLTMEYILKGIDNGMSYQDFLAELFKKNTAKRFKIRE